MNNWTKIMRICSILKTEVTLRIGRRIIRHWLKWKQVEQIFSLICVFFGFLFLIIFSFWDLYENGSGAGRQLQETRSDLTPEEAAALKRFKENDGIMERKLDQIIDGTSNWRGKALMMGEVFFIKKKKILKKKK